MKEYQSVEIPAKTESQLSRMTCDLCGKDAYTPSIPWGEGNYEVKETTVKMRTGTSYPEGGSGDGIEFDICPTCFENKLIPWLQSQGAEPRAQPWDW